MKIVPTLFSLAIGVLLLNSCSKPSIKQSKSSYLYLSKGEKNFRPYLAYKLNEFHFSTDIKYLEVVRYRVLSDSHSQKFTIPLSSNFKNIFKAGKIEESKKHKEDLRWLSKVILKKNYFWKKRVKQNRLYYLFTSLRFLDKKNRLSAIQNKEDIKDLLGEIDTEAELALWLYVIKDSQNIIGYKKINKLYRVRYKKQDRERCLTVEYFKFYNRKGEKVKYQQIAVKPYKCTNRNVHSTKER